jgi:hypothetical protein
VILFNENIVGLLNECFAKGEEYVESLLLASYGFTIQFVNLEIHCNERVFASINGARYEWDDAPNPGPWGSLGRQLAKKAVLKSPSLLSITFASGDSVEIETVEGPYESVILKFPSQADHIAMEVF